MICLNCFSFHSQLIDYIEKELAVTEAYSPIDDNILPLLASGLNHFIICNFNQLRSFEN